MLATFAALVGFLASLNLADRLAAHVNATVYHLADGGTLTRTSDSTYSLCYGDTCQIGDASYNYTDSLATLHATDCTGPNVTTCRGIDNLADEVYFGNGPGDGPGEECTHGGTSLACTTEYVRESAWTAADSADVADLAALIPGDYGYIRGQAYDTLRFERAISDSGRAADSARGDLVPQASAPVTRLVALAARGAVAPTSCALACRIED